MEYQKITKPFKKLQQNNSETVTNDYGKTYIYRKKTKIIDNLRPIITVY